MSLLAGYPQRIWFACALLCIFSSLSSESVRAQSSSASLELSQAASALHGNASAEARLDLARAVAENEVAMADLRANLRQITIRKGWITRELEQRREALAPALQLLLSMRRAPLATMLTHDAGPEKAAIALSAAAAIADKANKDLEALGRELEVLSALEEDAIALQNELQQNLSALQEARTALDQNPALANANSAGAGAGSIEAALLLANASSLSELSAGLASIGLEEVPEMGCSLPVSLAGDGILLPSGEGRAGLTFAYAGNQIIFAPCGGVVRFAAGFPGYGQLIIIEPARDMLFILGGFDNVYVEAGAVLETGFPIGSVGASGGDASELYVELRRGGTAIDPSHWAKPAGAGLEGG